MHNINKKEIASKLLNNFKKSGSGEQKVDLLSITKKLSEKRLEGKKKK